MEINRTQTSSDHSGNNTMSQMSISAYRIPAFNEENTHPSTNSFSSRSSSCPSTSPRFHVLRLPVPSSERDLQTSPRTPPGAPRLITFSPPMPSLPPPLLLQSLTTNNTPTREDFIGDEDNDQHVVSITTQHLNQIWNLWARLWDDSVTNKTEQSPSVSPKIDIPQHQQQQPMQQPMQQQMQQQNRTYQYQQQPIQQQPDVSWLDDMVYALGGLRPSLFGQVERFSVTNLDMKYSKECTVCQQPFRAGDMCAELKCEHTFHSNCLRTWLQKSHLCPNCRFDVCESIESKRNMD